MTLLGELSLWVAVVMAAWGSVVSFAGGSLGSHSLATSGARAMYATGVFLAVAAAGLWSALLRSDLSFEYVASHTTVSLPGVYKLGALWAGQGGSLLFAALILAVLASVAVVRARRHAPDLAPAIAGTLSVMILLLLVAVAFAANPYARTAVPPLDGRGLHPRLHHPALLLVSPNMSVGFVATAIPAATVLASLITRRVHAPWTFTVRRWTLVAWWFLTFAMFASLWWAYAGTGEGIRWTRAPIETGILLPWLAATALLHGIAVQDRWPMLRAWNIALAVATFILAAVAMVLGSGHAAQSAGTSPSLVGGESLAAVVILGVAATAYLMMSRRQALTSGARVEAVASREVALLLGTVLMVLLALAALGAMAVRPLSGAIGSASLAAPAVERLGVALGVAVLALAGAGPLLSWRRTSVSDLRRRAVIPAAAGAGTAAVAMALGVRESSGLATCVLAGFVLAAAVQEFVGAVSARRTLDGTGAGRAALQLVRRHRRRAAGHLVHAGLALLVVVLAGQSFRREFDVTLVPGTTYTAVDPFGREWRFESHGISRYQQRTGHVTAVAVRATADGGAPHLLTSMERLQVDRRGAPVADPWTVAGVLGTWRQHVFVVLADVEPGDAARLRIGFDPLVRWLWVAGAMLLAGAFLAAMPGRTSPSRPGAGPEAVVPGSDAPEPAP